MKHRISILGAAVMLALATPAIAADSHYDMGMNAGYSIAKHSMLQTTAHRDGVFTEAVFFGQKSDSDATMATLQSVGFIAFVDMDSGAKHNGPTIAALFAKTTKADQHRAHLAGIASYMHAVALIDLDRSTQLGSRVNYQT
jgi:hypothetical protein